MEIIGCGKGHYYNPNEHSSCPKCAEEGGKGTVGVTIPVSEQYHRDDHDNAPGPTEPVNGWSAVPQNGCSNNGFLKTTNFREEGKSMEGYGPTQPVYPAAISPVVGWLVCIEGPSKGSDYRIRSQYNYIGRARHMDICISGDECISAEKAAVIAYDDLKNQFFFGPGTGRNGVRVNGDMLMNPVLLNPFDELTIGRSKLLFVPLCGERFNWNGR